MYVLTYIVYIYVHIYINTYVYIHVSRNSRFTLFLKIKGMGLGYVETFFLDYRSQNTSGSGKEGLQRQ